MKEHPTRYAIKDDRMVQIMRRAGVKATATAPHVVILRWADGEVRPDGEDPLHALIHYLTTKEIWTHEQVEKLNEYQVAGVMHPFTCGNDHPGDKILVATVRGWICTGCDWTQDWAHGFMIDGSAVAAARRGMEGTA